METDSNVIKSSWDESVANKRDHARPTIYYYSKSIPNDKQGFILTLISSYRRIFLRIFSPNFH